MDWTGNTCHTLLATPIPHSPSFSDTGLVACKGMQGVGFYLEYGWVRKRVQEEGQVVPHLQGVHDVVMGTSRDLHEASEPLEAAVGMVLERGGMYIKTTSESPAQSYSLFSTA